MDKLLEKLLSCWLYKEPQTQTLSRSRALFFSKHFGCDPGCLEEFEKQGLLKLVGKELKLTNDGMIAIMRGENEEAQERIRGLEDHIRYEEGEDAARKLNMCTLKMKLRGLIDEIRGKEEYISSLTK